MSSLPHHSAEGPGDAPALILGPSLGTSLAVWDAQVPALARRHRVIRWDLPGHGGSPSALLEGGGSGREATVGDLAELVLRLADSLGIDRFGYAGVSLGGAVGAQLAVDHPDRVTSLALVCTSARFGDPGNWRERAATVRAHGVEHLAVTARQRWFTAGFTGGEDLVHGHRTADPAGYAACCDALAAFDLRPELHRVLAPTLVVAGSEDAATPPAHARELAGGIPGASLTEIPGAAHLAPVEAPEAVREALLAHFAHFAHGNDLGKGNG
jgi:3-oxoadipate enol-lactonase/4-carboxymuconolactone decarboxylase